MQHIEHDRNRIAGTRRGTALVFSLIGVVALAALCAGMLRMGGALTRESDSSIDELRALYVAEAGLTEAFSGLYAGKNGVVASQQQPAEFGHGVFWVEAEYLGAGQVALRSTGLVGSGRRALELVVEMRQSPVTSLGAFGDQRVQLESGARIDSFDSSEGTYAEQWSAAEGVAAVGSNGPIAVGANAVVLGDVTPGEGFAVDLGEAALLIGATVPGAQPTTLPPALVPELASKGSDTANMSELVVIQPGMYAYDSLDVHPHGQLVLSGPLQLVVGDLVVAPEGELVVDTSGGPVVVFVTGDVELHEGSKWTSVETDPTRALFYLLGNNQSPAGLEPLLGAVPATTPADAPADAGAAAWPVQTGLGAAAAAPSTPSGGGLGASGGPWSEFGWAANDAGAPANTLQLDATGALYGFLYAPNATLSLPASLHVLGGAAAKQLVLEAGAVLTEDELLLSGATAGAFTLEILSWAVDELPDVELVRNRHDPLSQLMLAGVTPLEVDQAHEQRFFRITYLDGHGITRTYEGVEELFDWPAVVTVLEIFREGEVSTVAAPMVPADAWIPSGQVKQASGRAFWWGTALADVTAAVEASLEAAAPIGPAGS